MVGVISLGIVGSVFAQTDSGFQSGLYAGGVSVLFPPNDQTITENSAVLKGTVSTQIEMPYVSLSIVSGTSPSQLGNEQILSLVPITQNQGMIPGEVKNFTVEFTGLTKGATYYFALRNKISNTTSSPIYFTTKGGTPGANVDPTGGSPIYDEETYPYNAPDPVGPVEDTISDKGIVPDCGRTSGTDAQKAMCGYKQFLELIANVIRYALIIIGPIVAIIAMFSGAMIMFLGSKSDPSMDVMNKLRQYKAWFFRAGIGLLIILSAWIIVATILRELGVKPEYVLLDLFSGK